MGETGINQTEATISKLSLRRKFGGNGNVSENQKVRGGSSEERTFQARILSMSNGEGQRRGEAVRVAGAKSPDGREHPMLVNRRQFIYMVQKKQTCALGALEDRTSVTVLRALEQGVQVGGTEIQNITAHILDSVSGFCSRDRLVLVDDPQSVFGSLLCFNHH